MNVDRQISLMPRDFTMLIGNRLHILIYFYLVFGIIRFWSDSENAYAVHPYFGAVLTLR